MVNPFNKEEFDRLLFVHNAKVEEKMKFVSEHAPEVFNALYAKYKPTLELPITPEMQKRQEELQRGLVKYNTFSTYYNLTKLETYNAMDGGAINKTMFKVNRSDEQTQQNTQVDITKENKYKAWVRVDFNNKRNDGSYEMEMFHENRNFNLREVLSNYNFKETNDRFARADVVKFLEKGSKVMVSNLSESGDEKVLIRANPEYKNIDIFKLSGEAIKSPKAYLKNPLAVDVADVVSLKKAGDIHRPNMNQDPMSAEKRQEKAAIFQSAKTIFVTGQKKTPPAGDNIKPDNKPSLEKESKPAQNGTVERRTRNSTRTVAESSDKQGISR